MTVASAARRAAARPGARRAGLAARPRAPTGGHRVEATPAAHAGPEEEWRRTSLDATCRGTASCCSTRRVATYDLDPPARRPRRGDLQRPGRRPCASTATCVRAHLGRGETLPTRTQPFWAARAGRLDRAAPSCYVPRGVAVDGTLVARTDAPGGATTPTFPHTLVVAEEDAASRSSRRSRSPDGGAGWFGGIADVQVGDGRAAALRQPAAARRRRLAHRARSGSRSARTPGHDPERGDRRRRSRKVGLDVRMTGKGGTVAAARPAGRGRRAAHRHQQRPGPARQPHHLGPALPVGALRPSRAPPSTA